MMDQLFTYILCLAPSLMVASVVLPKAVANRNKNFLVQFYKLLLFLIFILSILSLFPYFSGFRDKPINIFHIPINTHLELSISYLFTDMSVFLGILISLLGLITLKYSERYLSGEENQGYFYKWMVITIGSILSFVAANNLIVFAISWSISSWGIHVLLTFYPERAAGNFSAWKKFYISRLGDSFLGIATALCYLEFNTLQLDEIFAIIQNGNLNYTYTNYIGFFLAMGALTKSAQLPFHTWLPDTMESPTPVSALMHAGIINAGGVLLIKLSPLMNLSHIGLNLLVIGGGITAFVASIIMLTETSIKRSLAYSTISQMGLMILQCGLGAYSLAMVHIIGHSFYKAYSFLSSSSVLQKDYYKNPLPTIWERLNLSYLGVSVLLSIGIYFLIKSLLGVDALQKPGMLVLGPIFMMSMILFFKLRLSFIELKLRNVLYSILSMILFTGIYTGAYLFFETVIPVTTITEPYYSNEIQIFILLLIFTVFILQLTVKTWNHTGFGHSLYVHTRNGFYMDILLNQFVKPFTPNSQKIKK